MCPAFNPPRLGCAQVILYPSAGTFSLNFPASMCGKKIELTCHTAEWFVSYNPSHLSIVRAVFFVPMTEVFICLWVPRYASLTDLDQYLRARPVGISVSLGKWGSVRGMIRLDSSKSVSTTGATHEKYMVLFRGLKVLDRKVKRSSSHDSLKCVGCDMRVAPRYLASWRYWSFDTIIGRRQ